MDTSIGRRSPACARLLFPGPPTKTVRSSVAAEDLVIASMVAMSSVDWPGNLVCTLFLQGCPWRCVYCHNCDLIPMQTPAKVSWEKVSELLKRRSGLLDGVVFSGGEATGQRALVAAMRWVKEAGFQVGLHTAGAYPTRLKQILTAGLVDWVGLDIKASAGDYVQVTGVKSSGEKAWRSLDEVLAWGGRSEVRLTIFPNSPGDPLAVARSCKDRGVKVFALQQARALGAPSGFQADLPGWDRRFDELAKGVRELGFAQTIIRPAA